MAIIQIYFFCVFINTNNKSTQKNRLSETTHLGAQNQLYKQVDIDIFLKKKKKYYDVFQNAHLKYRLLLQCRQLSSITIKRCAWLTSNCIAHINTN